MGGLIESIRTDALKHGACHAVDSLQSVRQAGNLLFTPQGREFFKKTLWPTNELLKQCRNMMDYEVVVDKGYATVSVKRVLISGNSNITVMACNPDFLYHIIVAHGAKVTINASCYAVVTVTDVNASCIAVENDGTAHVVVE